MIGIGRRSAALGAALCAGALAAAAVPAAAQTGAAPAASAPVSRSGLLPGSASQHLLTADDVAALPAPSVAAGASRSAVARAFAVTNAKALGLTGSLGPSRSMPSVAGGEVVRFDQTVGGVPVMGGQVVVDVDSAGAVRGAVSETLPGAAPASTPAITSAQAAETARGLTARSLGGDASGLVVAAPTLTVFDPQILGVPGIPGARLAWRTEVTSTERPDVRQLVVVEALSGAVLLDIDQIAEGKNRTVCDGNNVGGVGVPCTSPVRTEGSTATGATDVDNAYTYAGIVYDYYKNTFNRDSVDNKGLPLVSTVRYCDSTSGAQCPLQNAFWNGDQMVYGDGFASADDVVAHELTHGVTENTSGLFYFFESGALNESISDIFGEYVDQTDGVGTDNATTKWQLGEDLPPTFGVIRDMQDPTLFNQPDSTDSPLFKTGVNRFGPDTDSGAVHTNSGVGNKFAYLLTDGDTFKGVTVTGIGQAKAEQIIYAATQLLTSASDYQAFAGALTLACSSLVGTKGITSADCTQVGNAIAATKMDVPPPARNLGAAPAACVNHPGLVPLDVFADDFESNTSGRWARAGFYYADQDNPFTSVGWVPQYATSGKNNIWGNDANLSTTATLTSSAAIKVPANGYLRFKHAFAFDQDTAVNGQYDGGLVEYSTSGAAGPWTLLPATNAANGYNGTLTASGTNPRRGSAAYTGTSRGYQTSVFDLAALAGQSITLRFTLATDSSFSSYGWFIDDVQVGGCATPDTTKPTLKAGALATVSVKAPVVTATATDNRGVSGFVVKKRYAGPKGAFTAWSAPVFRAGTSLRWVEKFVAGRTTCFSIQAKDTTGNLSAAQTRCTTTPLDDRSLTRSKTGWASSATAAAYLKTLSVSKTKGASLTLKGATGKSLVLVVRKGKGAGTVSVWIGTTRKAVLKLSGTATVQQVRLPVTTGAFTNRTVVIKVDAPGTAGVAIDGLAVRRA